MFDLSNIDFIKTNRDRANSGYSFVGIQRNQETNRLEFWLPLGFENFDTTDFQAVKQFFFKMYKTFKVYVQRREIEANGRTTDRDGIIENEDGCSFIRDTNEQAVFYSKLNALDKILDGYDELRIIALEQKNRRSEKIDYSKIYRYMHQAVYLDRDIIYIDEMNVAKSVLDKESPPILQIFCFIFTEIKRELDELETVSDKAIELSEEFIERYLQHNGGLFSENSFLDTIQVLREVLETIDLTTAYKDEDYWHFFEAVEAFLYGERQEDEQGIYWGLSQFYDVWEDMCQTYALNTPEYKEKTIFADIRGRLEQFRYLKQPHPFQLNLNQPGKARYLRPDLVVQENTNQIEDFYKVTEAEKKEGNNIYKINVTSSYFKKYSSLLEIYKKYLALSESDEKRQASIRPLYLNHEHLNQFEEECQKFSKTISKNYVRIVDYKYMRVSDYEDYNPNDVDLEGKNKVKDDIKKQLLYEWAIQQNWRVKTESEFWIPGFFSGYSAIDFKRVCKVQNSEFNKSQIKLIQINFMSLQNFYIAQT